MTSPRQGARTPKGAEPVRAHGSLAPDGRQAGGKEPPGDHLLACADYASLTPQQLLFVSAGMAGDGGGIAAASRLLLSTIREWAACRNVRLRVLTLGDADELPPGVDGVAFGGDRQRLALAVWRAQLAGYRWHVYDFLGTARIQGLLPRGLRARYLLYLWGLECWRPLHGTRRTAIDAASVLLACSRFTVEGMQRHNPTARAATVLPLALSDATPADPAERSAAGASEADSRLLAELGEGFLLIVGRMAPGERYKGHDVLLQAMPALRARHPRASLVVAGEGEDRPRLQALAASLGLGSSVRFTGFVSATTLAELYRRCAVFAMPSSGEGFGLVYLEAMRAARPCVALLASAAAEIVEDRVTGRLVDGGAEPLAAALGELLADPVATRAMGEAARERWYREFRHEHFAARLQPYLDELVPQRARG